MKKYIRRFAAFLTAIILFVPLLPTSNALQESPPHATAAIVVDGDNNEVLYDYNAHEKRFPASVTKIMTTLVVLRAIDAGEISLDTQVTASRAAVNLPKGSSSAGIQEGETLTIEQLLYCDLLPSGNDACNVLSEALCDSQEEFVARMNDIAADLGMTGTHFENPHGLHHPNHYTTAYDIYLMSSAAMQYDIFRKIVATPVYTLPPNEIVSEPRVLHNTNGLISNWYVSGCTYSKAIGIKTGYTPEAGRCLASAATDEQGRTFYCVILGSEFVRDSNGTNHFYSFTESSRLLEWAFDNFHRKPLLSDNLDNLIREIPVSLSADTGHILVQPSGSVEATVPKTFDPTQAQIVMDLPEHLEAPIQKDQVLGRVSFVYNGTTYGPLDMVAVDGVTRSDLLYVKKVIQDIWSMWWVKILTAVVVVALLFTLVYIWLMRPFRRRNRRRYSYAGSAKQNYRGRRR